MDVGHHDAEWRSDLLLGSSNLAATEFYQPLGGTRLFVVPYAFASKLARNAFSGQTRTAVFGDERAGGGLDLGFNVNRHSEIRFGYEIFEGKLDPLIGSAGLPIVRGSTGQLRLRYVWDGQDNSFGPQPRHSHRRQSFAHAAKPEPFAVHRSNRPADFHFHSHRPSRSR